MYCKGYLAIFWSLALLGVLGVLEPEEALRSLVNSSFLAFKRAISSKCNSFSLFNLSICICKVAIFLCQIGMKQD